MATRKGPIRVLHYGLGPIGAAVVKQIADRRGFKIVGAVDIDPAKAGRDLGKLAKHSDKLVRIFGSTRIERWIFLSARCSNSSLG